MDFWNELAKTLDQRNFSPTQIKQLRAQFGDLDADALLRIPTSKLVSVLVDNLRRSERAVLDAQAKLFYTTVQLVQGRFIAEPAPDNSYTVPSPTRSRTSLDALLATNAAALEKANIRSTQDLRSLTRRSEAERREIALEVDAQRAIEAYSTLAAVFPSNVAQALFDAGANDVTAVADWSHATFLDALVRGGIPAQKATYELTRFYALKRAVATNDRDKVPSGLELDLRDESDILSRVQETLKDSGVETLTDWALLRDTVDVNGDIRQVLDAHARLADLGATSEIAAGLVKRNIVSAYELAQLNSAQIEKLAENHQAPVEEFYAVIELARQRVAMVDARLRNSQTAAADTAPAWIRNLQIVGSVGTVYDICVTCPDEISVFSCFAYIIDLIQKTGKTLNELSSIIDINLSDLSAASVGVLFEDTDPDCEKTQLCEAIIQRLHAYLDELGYTATSRAERELYTYTQFETWRANRMGFLFPELNALWRDDVLTGNTGKAERGSIVSGGASTIAYLAEQLQVVDEALELARVHEAVNLPHVTTSVWNNAPLFKDTYPVYYADFIAGLAVIEAVLAADQTVHDALIYLDREEPGLALQYLDEALAYLDGINGHVFDRTSAWIAFQEADLFSYETLLKMPPAARKEVLDNLFTELVYDDKKLFKPRNLDIQITGLSDSGDVDLSSGWEIRNEFREEYGKIVKYAFGQSTSLVRYTENSVGFSNLALTADITLDEQLTDNQSIGIGLRLDTDTSTFPLSGYRLMVRHKIYHPDENIVDVVLDTIFGDDDISIWVETLVIQKLVEGPNGERIYEQLAEELIASKTFGAENATRTDADDYHLLRADQSYSISFSVTGATLKGQLQISPNREIEITAHDSSSSYTSGTFGFYASASTQLQFSNIQVEIDGSGGGYPPFHAYRRVTQRHILNTDVYTSHVSYGTGMALAELVEAPLTVNATKRAAVSLSGLSGTGTTAGLHLLFDEGQPLIVTHRLDALLENCLVMAFYLRFVVIPTRLAQAHAMRGDYARAADYLHLLYDDSNPNATEAEHEIYPFLTDAPDAFTTTIGADTRLLRMRLADIYLAWAEWLFRQDTTTSRHQARQLYERVLTLHGEANRCDCDATLGSVVEELLERTLVLVSPEGPADISVATSVLDLLKVVFAHPAQPVDHSSIIREHIPDLPDDGVTDPPAANRLPGVVSTIRNTISDTVERYQESIAKATHVNELLENGQRLHHEVEIANVALQAAQTDPVKVSYDAPKTSTAQQPHVADAHIAKTLAVDTRYRTYTGAKKAQMDWYYYPITYTLCIPGNPLKQQQKQRACLMLDLLNTCRNILGFGDNFVPPLRFEALIRLANSFTDSSYAAERDLLAFRQALESESYSHLQATNSLALTDANIGLEALNVDLAYGDVQLANLQSAQVQYTLAHFQDLINNGLTMTEKLALGAAWSSAAFSGLSAAGGLLSAAATAIGIGTSATGNAAGVAMAAAGIAGTLLGGAQGLASFSGSVSNAASMQASYERRREEWGFNVGRSQAELAIAQQNIMQAVARYGIAQRRYAIAQLERDLAASAVRYLEHKFLNTAMLTWLQRTSRDVYRTRLNYAIAAAFMAERALAFELQNQALRTIRFDYFDPRRDGLLGATQLQTDLKTLENMRLTYMQRRLQLSKTISLAHLLPIAFQLFKSTGSILFNTLRSLFDHEFPGHYLRLIKSVKISVIALIPPHNGIRATLRNSGMSTVVVGPPYSNTFVPHTIQRNPEAVALSAPMQSTGLFILDYEGDLLLPFEGGGVDTEWLFELPRAANHFDYQTIVDVLVTIEYTALESLSYRQHIIDQLDNSVITDRFFSFRQHFADQWYDLHNPDLVQGAQQPMVAAFETHRADFSPNLDSLSIEHIMVYIIGDSEVDTLDITLTLTDPVMGYTQSATATTSEGIISTRQPTGNPWQGMQGKTPLGQWKLAFDDTPEIRQLFANDSIQDILFVITFTGQLPAWSS